MVRARSQCAIPEQAPKDDNYMAQYLCRFRRQDFISFRGSPVAHGKLISEFGVVWPSHKKSHDSTSLLVITPEQLDSASWLINHGLHCCAPVQQIYNSVGRHTLWLHQYPRQIKQAYLAICSWVSKFQLSLAQVGITMPSFWIRHDCSRSSRPRWHG